MLAQKDPVFVPLCWAREHALACSGFFFLIVRHCAMSGGACAWMVDQTVRALCCIFRISCFAVVECTVRVLLGREKSARTVLSCASLRIHAASDGTLIRGETTTCRQCLVTGHTLEAFCLALLAQVAQR